MSFFFFLNTNVTKNKHVLTTANKMEANVKV